MERKTPVTLDAWSQLRGVTQARIALGRAGGSLPTRQWLDFKAAHAAARDAVHNEFDAEDLAAQIGALGPHAVVVETGAKDRQQFLQRPDLGRQLDEPSRRRLAAMAQAQTPAELVIVASDGLSALAAHRQVVPVLAELLPRLSSDRWGLAPVVLARFGRVALQDDIGQLLGATLALMLIGERPGLGSPDSLGAYMVFGPRVGNSDAQRNCVSNIRAEGLPPNAAAETLQYLLNEARRRRLSGVQLKDQRSLATSPPARQMKADS